MTNVRSSLTFTLVSTRTEPLAEDKRYTVNTLLSTWPFQPEIYGESHITYQSEIVKDIAIPVCKASSPSSLFLNVVTSGNGASSSTRIGSDTTRDGGGSGSRGRDGGGRSSLGMETRKDLLYFFLSKFLQLQIRSFLPISTIIIIDRVSVQ